jgi:hypothetical protein
LPDGESWRGVSTGAGIERACLLRLPSDESRRPIRDRPHCS